MENEKNNNNGPAAAEIAEAVELINQRAAELVKKQCAVGIRPFKGDPTMLTKICDRARELMNLSVDDAYTVRLSLIFAHDNDGRRVDLDRLMTFPDGDFVHDVDGIDAHASRDHETCGLLLDCFVPRCGFVDYGKEDEKDESKEVAE